MGSLKKCLDRLKGAFSSEEVAILVNASDKYKKEGDSDLVADSKAVLDFNEFLHDQMNKLRTKVGLQSAKFAKPEVKIVEPPKEEIKEEIKVEVKPEPKKEEVKEEKKAKPVTDKDVKIAVNKIFATPPKTFEDAVVRFLYKGGRISTSDFKRYTGFGEKNKLTGKTKGATEFRKYIWAYKNDATSIDNLVSKLWKEDMNMPEESFDEQDRINEFFDVLKEHSGKGSLLGRIFEIQKEDKQVEDYADPEMIRYAKELEAEEKANYERELSESEVAEELEKEAAREQVFAETGQFQKSTERKGDVQKVLDRIKKVMPKVNVVVDEKMDAAGKVQGNTLTINPYYAGIDTPIHEAGHILIDAIGYGNKVIQSAIKQLKDTKLWKETKERYSELNDEMLAKEVLAEAIGIEGAGIFDKEVDKNRFKTFLDYIFTKLKQLLGIDKNVAKSLAKQIIAGIGTKELTGTTAEAQMAKRKPVSEEEQGIIDMIEMLNSESDLNKYTDKQLLEAYEDIMSLDVSEKKKNKYLKEVMVRIAMNIYDRQLAKNLKENPDLNPEEAARRDIQYKDVKLKVLSHFTDAFPTMQYLSEQWDEHFFNKVTESREKRKINEELAVEVIKDRNKKLGISLERGKEWIQSLFTNINHKYFDYLDNGKGKLITVKEAQAKGLSKAQIDYLKFVRELIAERKTLMEDENVYDMDMEVLRMDKGFAENFRTEGITQAFSSLIGNPHNLEKVRIQFTNPITGKSQISDYSTIEKILTDYGKKGIKEKAHSLYLITKYNMKARRQLKLGYNVDQVGDTNALKVARGGEYTLDENGQLQSKFSRKRSESRSYSKDFYKAVHEYIDDNAHIKHISPLIPIIDSIEYLNKNGLVRDKKVIVGAKDNVAKWMDEWKKLHVLKKQDEGVPELDLALRTLRFMTSASTMLFNVPANLMNVAVGLYNNFREEGLSTIAKGQARLFGGKDRKFGILNKYAFDILKKYGAVSTDVESNPVRTLGGKFFELGFLGQKWGEFQIQGSGLLGLMTDEDYNSFEYKVNKYGVEELVVKDGVDEKELKKRILNNINKVSDVQGKYSDKDKMNIVNNELGKAVFQMKTWMPMYFRARFGEKGSAKIAWDNFIKDGFKEMRDAIKEDGIKSLGENKAFMKNLRGLMFTAFLVSLVYMDDDDDEKSATAKYTQKLLSDVLFIFDFNNLKFTLTRPVASIGVIEKLINAADHLFAFESDDFYKADSKYGSKGDPKILGDMISLSPVKKIADIALEEE